MLRNRFNRPKSSGAYMRDKIGYTISPIAYATILADNSLVIFCTFADDIKFLNLPISSAKVLLLSQNNNYFMKKM